MRLAGRKPESGIIELFPSKGLNYRHGGEGLFRDLVDLTFDLLLLVASLQHWPGVELKH